VSEQDPKAGWTFDNGREFPGAAGSLTADSENRHDGRDSLKLVGDFTNGGGYVQAGRKFDKPVDVSEISMWVRSPAADRFTLRLSDGSGQTHQIVMKTEASDRWQRVVLPFDRFFTRRGEADAVTNVAKYESWGGAKDGRWHGPASAMYVIIGKPEKGADPVRTFWIGDVTLAVKPSPVGEVASSVALDEYADGKIDGWRFSKGEEFKGAEGSLTVVDGPVPQHWLRLAGDFTGGGAYVAAIRDLKGMDLSGVTAIRMRTMSSSASSVGVQMVDASGQTHQRKGIPVGADGQWHDLALEPAKIAGGEHWGGANDGKWHDPPTLLAISVTAASDKAGKRPVIELAHVVADAKVPVFARPAAFKASFDEAALDKAWVVSGGGASVDQKSPAYKGGGSLLLARSLDDVEKPCAVTGPAFPASPGKWQVSLATRAELDSPDNSYSGVVELEALDGGGRVTEKFTVADVFGKHEWAAIAKQVELPRGTANARFAMKLNKTHGSFWVDEFSASYLAPAARKDDRVARLLFSTAGLGNLLLPDDSRKVEVTVEARRALPDELKRVRYVVRDYWGSEQGVPADVFLGKAEKKGDRQIYKATIDLAPANLEMGRYYEVHAWVGDEAAGAEPFRNYTSLAILPEAATKKYKPEEVPFTSRNWDNRFPEYMRLTDRLGVRVCGVWGGWSDKPPYKPEAPNLDLVKELGMGWLTNTPCAGIERGEKKYDETALRQGVRNLIEKFGQNRPMYINLGNEPHGTGDKVLRNVAAYKAVYEEVKKVDPTIPVIATSVEPNEEYFKAGYGKYCDAFDFHIYETAADVRRTIGEYKALMKKYGVEKPLWSTELGLNSQGLPRHVVAQEVTRKFVTFFAAGGANVSWFTLLYPDPEGKDHGSSGDSHNVFDCRFNHYAPRLDAVAYYNAVNAIAVKKFVGERQYADGVNAFLFRDKDGHALQVLWKDKGRADVSVPLAGVRDVLAIRVDGRRRPLDAGGEALTLSVGEDPLILLYDGGPAALPAELGAPAATIAAPPTSFSRGGRTTLSVSLKGAAAGDVALVAPPMWKVESTRADGPDLAVRFTVTPAPGTAAHQGDLIVTLGKRGELYCRAPIGE
jgi:hypothetical protein